MTILVCGSQTRNLTGGADSSRSCDHCLESPTLRRSQASAAIWKLFAETVRIWANATKRRAGGVSAERERTAVCPSGTPPIAHAVVEPSGSESAREQGTVETGR